ncbi:glycosyltransferase family 2 protein [Roseobacteraceae bacterium NS-SX3]
MAASAPDTRRSAPRYLEPLFQGRQRVKYWALSLCAALASLYFWTWWLHPEHILGPGRFIMVSLVLGWLNFLVLYFFVFFLKSKRPVAHDEELTGARVAMIVTKTPSEPFALLQETLEAMLAQELPEGIGPHDTWLADEAPEPATIAWCRARGVRISTRRGLAEYHRAEWPRRTRCKEGNLAFFYDRYGYGRYDFVAQLDADHVPQPGYLYEMLKPFADPAVGYVSAPSICCRNAPGSWAARTRLYTEAMFHGVFQAGYSDNWAPMCIGSHYAVRTRALREAGGLGPELAEDHSTSLLLNAAGWRGVHAIDAIAFGAGPDSISDMATQEFQWSRSLVTLLLSHTGRYLPRLPWRLKFQFLFSQLFYPVAALAHLAMFLIPVCALLFDMRFADVTYPGYIAHAAPAAAVLTWLVIEVRRDRLFRPLDAKIFGWEKILFVFLQWPWVLWGCIMAVRDKLTGTFVDFRITPKGGQTRPPLPWRFLLPYLALALISLLAVLLAGNIREASGFYLLALINAAVYATAFSVMVINHCRENGIAWRPHLPRLLPQYLAIPCLVLLTALALWTRGVQSLHALTTGLGAYQFTEVQFYVSGAGQPHGMMRFRLKEDWPPALAGQ